MTVAAAGGDPLAPFVVGDEGRDYEDDGEDGEEEFHGWFRDWVSWGKYPSGAKAQVYSSV